MFGCPRIADGLTVSCAVSNEVDTSHVVVAASRIRFMVCLRRRGLCRRRDCNSAAVQKDVEKRASDACCARSPATAAENYAATMSSTDVSAETPTSDHPTFLSRVAGGGNAANAPTKKMPG